MTGLRTEWASQVRQRRLANGLTVLVREDRSAPVVATMTHVKAGYFDEPDSMVGISHVLEHMYFKGSARRAAGEVARQIKAAGGYTNAGTTYDYTSYYAVLPSSSFQEGLDIQADALLHPAMDEGELQRELRVILQEVNRKRDNPAAVAQESLYETMFDTHRMRRWRMGTETGLARLTGDDLRRYHQGLYRPGNVVLSIVGDVDAGRALDLADHFYGTMPAGEIERDPGPDEPDRRGFRCCERAGDLVRTHLHCGWRTPGPLHADTPALELLAAVLGHGRASRLYREVRETGLVSTIAAYHYAPRSVGLFGISAELDSTSVPEALQAVARTVARARQVAPAEGELTRAKTALEAALLRRLETAVGQAGILAEWQGLGDWRLFADYERQIDRTTTAHLLDVAERYLEPERGTLFMYQPTGAAPVGHDAAALWARAPRDLAPASAVAMGGPTHQTPPIRAARRRLPVRVEYGVHRYERDGVVVVVKPRPSPLVVMSICGLGGLVDESADNAGITALLVRSAIRGTMTRSPAEVAEAIEALGGALAPNATADLFEWNLSVPRGQFDAGFELLADVALAPRFPAAGVERERAAALSDLARIRDDLPQYVLRRFFGGAFARHPYGFSFDEMARATERLTADDLAAWHARVVTRGRITAFVVGGVDPDSAARTALDRLRCLAPAVAPVGETRPNWPQGPLRLLETRDRAQTSMLLGLPGPTWGDAHLDALLVLCSVVSGNGGRLFEELRSRHALAYSVSAYPVPRRLAGAFVVSLATDPRREEEARARLLEQLGSWVRDTLSERDVARAQRYSIGTWQIRNQTNGEQLTELARALLLGEGLEWLHRFEERMLAVTPDLIRDVASRYLATEQLVESVVRGCHASAHETPCPC